MTARRFPPPWSVEEQEVCFVVRDRGAWGLASISRMSRAASTRRRGAEDDPPALMTEAAAGAVPAAS